MTTAKRVTSATESELIIILDTETGQVVLKGAVPSQHEEVASSRRVEIYSTGLVSEVPVAARIWITLGKVGKEHYGLSTKCINVNKDHISQILSLLKAGIDWPVQEKEEYLKEREDVWRSKGGTPWKIELLSVQKLTTNKSVAFQGKAAENAG